MGSRALVLGSGGVTGLAWELGLLAGLADAGIDLGEADLVLGTSSGAVAGAAVASGVDLHARYSVELLDTGAERAVRMAPTSLLRFTTAMITSRDPLHFRRRIGKLALAARTEPEVARRTVIESRLSGVSGWPACRLDIVAVDAESGHRVTFCSESNVDLVDAVAASSATPGVRPPMTIDGRSYIDGGIFSPANADLAAGYERILVLAPDTGGGPVVTVTEQVSELRDRAAVVLITPDTEAQHAAGHSIHDKLDPARRAGAARAGRAQADTAADAVLALWQG